LTGEKAERRGRVEQTKRKHWVRLGAFAFVVTLISWAATWVGLSGTWVGDDWHMVNNYLYEDWAELAVVFKRNAASQDAYDHALLRDHFDDPGVQYYFASVAARRANGTGLREHLSSMPSPPWPTPIIISTAAHFEEALAALSCEP